MKNQNKIKIIKITLTVVILVALAIFFWKIAPFMMDLSTTEGQIAFKNKINSMGFLGLLLLFSLQVLQILLVILPGEPFEVLAGMCYGTWGGWLFITVSILITTIIIFFSSTAVIKSCVLPPNRSLTLSSAFSSFSVNVSTSMTTRGAFA